MNLHITPSFSIDRLFKTASVLLFLVSFQSEEYKGILKVSLKSCFIVALISVECVF